MKKDRGFLEWLSEGMDLPLDTIPAKSIVEISADQRVLIENHLGVNQYSDSCICIKVSFGNIRICGNGLELVQMTKEQLIISGRIDGLTFIRGNRE